MRVLFSILLFVLLSNSTIAQDNSLSESAFSDGIFNLMVGRFEDAENSFTISIEAGEQLAKSYYYRSKARSGQRNFESALLDINQSLKLEPKDNLTLDMRGKIYLALKRPEEALPDFSKVLAIDSTFEDIHFSLGRAYYGLDLYEKAIDELTLAIKVEPEDSKSYRLRGLSCLVKEWNEEGCNDLSKARKLGEQGLDDLINEYCGEVEIATENKNTEYDWNFYDEPKVIDKSNASNFTEFSKNDPESMVEYFYASRIRGDEKWKDVLQAENQWSRRLTYSLEKYEHWKFLNFHLVKKKRHSELGWWIMVYFEIEVNGESDGGKDEVSLEFNGKEWVITKVPN